MLRDLNKIDKSTLPRDGQQYYELAKTSFEWKLKTGTTKKGFRCKNRTTNQSGRCHHHQ